MLHHQISISMDVRNLTMVLLVSFVQRAADANGHANRARSEAALANY